MEHIAPKPQVQENFPLLLTEDDIVAPTTECQQFRSRYLSIDECRTKWAILTLWEAGDMAANEAIYALRKIGVIKDNWLIPFSPNAFLQAFIEHERMSAS